MAVQRDGRTGLEADQIHHRRIAEQRSSGDAGDELERADLVELDELWLHAARLSLPA